MSPEHFIDTPKFSSALRAKAIDTVGRRIRVTRFDGSQQAKDLSLPPNCGGFGRIHHFHRFQAEAWPPNPLPIDPALHALGLPRSDSLQAQVFQYAACSWRCWYCFVDFDLLSANPEHSEFKTVGDLLELYMQEEIRPALIDLSGGQPDLVPEWLLWFCDELRERKLEKEVYLWSDDNLSNDYLWEYLTPREVDRIRSFPNYGRVGCFKGFDERSFSYNTQADPKMFATQFRIMRRLVQSGLDVFGYATFTSDSDERVQKLMADFFDRLQSEVHPLFPLRTIPLRIHEFTPTRARMKGTHERSIQIQDIAVAAWSEELAKRFPLDLREKRIYEHRIDSALHA